MLEDNNIFSNPSAGEQPTQNGFNSFANSASLADSMHKFGMELPGIPSMGATGEPTAEDIEKQMEAVRFSKVVKVQDCFVETFDFSKKDDVERYRALYKDLYAKTSEGKVFIKCNERQFISCPTNPRWVLHMEWLEYDLQVTDHMMNKGE